MAPRLDRGGRKQGNVQAYREELGDTSQDHNDRNQKVDDPAAESEHELADSYHFDVCARPGRGEAPALSGPNVQAVGEIHFVFGVIRERSCVGSGTGLSLILEIRAREEACAED